MHLRGILSRHMTKDLRWMLKKAKDLRWVLKEVVMYQCIHLAHIYPRISGMEYQVDHLRFDRLLPCHVYEYRNNHSL